MKKDKLAVGKMMMTISFFLLSFSSMLRAQVQNNAPLYVFDYGEMYLSTGNYSFGTAGTTQTTRTAVNYGLLSFGSGATWTDASNTHYTDGYVRSYGGSDFIFPVGQSGIFAPFRVSPISVSSGKVDGAYYASNPSGIGASIDSSVSTISANEYWNIISCNTSNSTTCSSYNANLTLTWSNSSAVAALTSSTLTNLTIVGWNGSSWQRIESTVDTTSILGGTSSYASGSITTTVPIDLSQFLYYTLGNKGNSCAALIPSSGITKTWNGSWSPSVPTLADNVVINSAYNGNLACNSLVLNANITISDGQLVEIINGASGTGKIIMSSEASLVQRNPNATAPNIEMTKITNPMRRYDYIFLSSPINNGATYYSNLTSNLNVAVDGNYGSQLASAFSNFKSLDATGNQVFVTTATIGKGLRALVRSQTPYSTSTAAWSWNNEKKNIYIKTSGVANNGDVQVIIPANTPAFIGNPYPSAIDGQKLLEAAGTNVVQTIYYWTYNSPMRYPSLTYNPNDFATWTTAGGVAVCPTCQVPDGSIASMQSIYIKGGASDSTFNITNCMRKTTGNDNFFRVAPTDRYWLNMTGSSGSFSQILIAYSGDATLGDDSGLDGKRYGNGDTSTLSSLINGTKFAIQARPSFDTSDAVPLAVDKMQNDNLSISLGNKEGIFNTGITIFLHDITLGIYHDLATGPYSFIQSDASDITRFEIVYQDNTLTNPNFDTSTKLLAYIKNETLNIQSSLPIKTIDLFDITGRKIKSINTEFKTLINEPFLHAQGVYLAKIILDNDVMYTQKLINE